MQNETKQVQKPNGSTLELTKTFKNTRKDNKQGKIEMQKKKKQPECNRARKKQPKPECQIRMQKQQPQPECQKNKTRMQKNNKLNAK